MVAPDSVIPSALDSSFAPSEFARHRATARDFDDDDPAQGAPLLEALMAGTARPSLLGLPAGAGAVLQAAALVAFTAIALALAGARLGFAPAWVRLFDNVHWTVADVGAAWLAWIGVRDARDQGRCAEYAARRWFARGFSLYAIGQLLWVLQIVLDWRPLPPPSDPFCMMLAPCCVLGMLGTLRGHVDAARRLAVLLGTLSLAIVAAVFVRAILPPVPGDVDALALVVLVATPALLLAGAGTGLMLIALLRGRRTWPAWLLTATLAGHGVLWLAWNAQGLRHVRIDGGVVGALFPVCTLLGGLAATRWRVGAARSRP